MQQPHASACAYSTPFNASWHSHAPAESLKTLLTLHPAGYIFGVIGQIAGPALGYIEDADSNSRPTAQAGPKEPIYRVGCVAKNPCMRETPGDSHARAAEQSSSVAAPGMVLLGSEWCRRRPLQVTFHQKDLWEGYRGAGGDTLQLEVRLLWTPDVHLPAKTVSCFIMRTSW